MSAWWDAASIGERGLALFFLAIVIGTVLALAAEHLWPWRRPSDLLDHLNDDGILVCATCGKCEVAIPGAECGRCRALRIQCEQIADTTGVYDQEAGR